MAKQNIVLKNTKQGELKMPKKNIVMGFNATQEEYDEINDFFNERKHYSKGNMMKMFIIDGIKSIKLNEKLERSNYGNN